MGSGGVYGLPMQRTAHETSDDTKYGLIREGICEQRGAFVI